MRRFLTVAFILSIVACGGQEAQKPERKGLAKDITHELSFETLSVLIQDMNDFSAAVKSLNQSELQRIDERYKGVTFSLERVPLVLNSFADPSKGGVVFLVFPKDPQSGSNYLLTVDRALPIVQDQTLELQFRTRDPESPLECVMKVPDATSYLNESKKHHFAVRFTLSKSFLQSGTYDFDALSVPSYRTRGYAFIVFDLMKVQLQDTDAKLVGDCRI